MLGILALSCTLWVLEWPALSTSLGQQSIVAAVAIAELHLHMGSPLVAAMLLTLSIRHVPSPQSASSLA